MLILGDSSSNEATAENHKEGEMMIDDDFDDEILEELREEKASFRSIINKKRVTKWELDDAFVGEM